LTKLYRFVQDLPKTSTDGFCLEAQFHYEEDVVATRLVEKIGVAVWAYGISVLVALRDTAHKEGRSIEAGVWGAIAEAVAQGKEAVVEQKKRKYEIVRCVGGTYATVVVAADYFVVDDNGALRVVVVGKEERDVFVAAAGQWQTIKEVE
jgi:hypothetical protein